VRQQLIRTLKHMDYLYFLTEPTLYQIEVLRLMPSTILKRMKTQGAPPVTHHPTNV
jgi:hypothetical protein